MCVIDLVGEKFGKLTVTDMVRKNNRTYCICICECGNIKTISQSHLRSGNTKSCGCWQKDHARILFTKHKKSTCDLYGVWQTMKQRCVNHNHKNYKNYGGRNIKVCDEWLCDFQLFYYWAICNGYKKGLTLDRINVNGDYEPTNCRWVTQLEQQNNRRNNILIEYKGDTKTLSQWGRKLGINVTTLYKRIFINNWDIEKSFTTPVRKYK